MRFKHFKPSNLTEEQLDELRMNPGSLRAFADSPEAEGIQAGFEAELVFTGLGGEPEYDEDPEPDYDADERCISIDGVVEFFQQDDYGYGISDREANKLRDNLDEMYYEWQDNQMYDQWRDERDDLIKEYFLNEQPLVERVHAMLVDGMELSDEQADRIQAVGEKAPKFNSSLEQETYIEANPDYRTYIEALEGAEEILNEEVESCIASEDKNYDYVLEEFRDGFYIDDDSGFFSDVGLRWMSDVANEFDLMWPVITYTGASSEGGFSEENARRLANDLSERLGIETYVSSGYHNAARKPGRWIFEPDSSLDADDSDNMPVEIVSPPMPLKDCLRFMEDFFTWAEDNGAYANSSTGFHMGVSLPHRGGAVDYLKLALFLGDEHVLDEFGRRANHFCEAAIKKIRQRVRGGEKVGDALELMKSNLIELAAKQLGINPHGYGKYTSINPKGGVDSTYSHKERGADYIEFRGAGGSNYFEDIDKLKNTLLRYAKAMTVAADPAAERREYYKKLYKLISPPEGDASMDLFSRFATGSISADELKKSWAEKALEKDAPELVGKGDWVVIDTSTGKVVQGQEYNGFTRDEVRARAKQKLSPASSDIDFDKSYSIEPKETGEWEIYTKDPDTGEENTLEIVSGERRGEAVDKVYDKYSSQNIPFFARAYYGGEKKPEPKLTPRAELAKRIKTAPEETPQHYRITNTQNGEVVYDQEGRKSKLVQIMRKYETDNKLPRGALKIELLGPARERPADADRSSDWEYFYKPTGRVFDTLAWTDYDGAMDWLPQVMKRHDFDDASKIGVRRAGEGQDNDRQELEPVIDQPPQGFVTQRPATGDYYEVRSGDRVYGYLSVAAGSAPGGLGPARAAREYVNNLTGRNDAQLVYKSGNQQNQQSNNPNPTAPIEGQVRMPNGVPVWELVDHMSGTVLHAIADHTSREAYAEGMAWLRSYGAEDPSTYGERFYIRPKMLQAGEQNLSPTIREGIANRAFANFDAYFESVITPVKKRLK